MGTSTPFGGGKNGNPLLPTWLNDPAQPDPFAPPAPSGDDTPQEDAASLADGTTPDGAPVPEATTESPRNSEFTSGRTNFSRYAKSEGDDRRALGRALRGYVRKVAGGSATAARRMGSEKAAVGNLANLLGGAGAAPGGVREFLATIDLAALATLPIEDIYSALVDYICPPDGTLDDAYAREAYLEALADLTGREIDLEHPTDATAQDFIGSFIANAVHLRIINAIGVGIVSMPLELATAMAHDAGLMDFIRAHVDDVLAEAGGPFRADAFKADIDRVFELVLRFIDDAADVAAEGR